MIKRTFADIPIFEFDEIDSTNSYCVDNINLLKNDFSGSSSWIKTIISARSQTKGKGRRGREWISEPDSSMLASFIVDPLHFGTMLDTTLLITLINEVLQTMGVPCGIKWPNDICILRDDQRIEKLGGVLTEIVDEYLVIGVGINIKSQNMINVEYVSTLNDYDINISQTELINKILVKVMNVDVKSFFNEAILARYINSSLTFSTRVRVQTMTEEFEGKVIGFANSGALILELEEKKLIELSEGDVIHLR